MTKMTRVAEDTVSFLSETFKKKREWKGEEGKGKGDLSSPDQRSYGKNKDCPLRRSQLRGEKRREEKRIKRFGFKWQSEKVSTKGIKTFFVIIKRQFKSDGEVDK